MNMATQNTQYHRFRDPRLPYTHPSSSWQCHNRHNLLHDYWWLFSGCHTNHLMQSKYHLYSTTTIFMNNSKYRSNGTLRNDSDLSALNRSQIATWFERLMSSKDLRCMLWYGCFFDACCLWVCFYTTSKIFIDSDRWYT